MVAERTREQLNVDVPLTQDLLSKTRNQKESLDTSYNNRRLKRAEEVKIIQMAYNIVASSPVPN